jgi:hypothetical protein
MTSTTRRNDATPSRRNPIRHQPDESPFDRLRVHALVRDDLRGQLQLHDPGHLEPAGQVQLRSAGTRAGLDYSDADCIVRYLTSRYSPSDYIPESAVERAGDYCL